MFLKSLSKQIRLFSANRAGFLAGKRFKKIKRVGKGFSVNCERLFLITVIRERKSLFPGILDRKYSRDS